MESPRRRATWLRPLILLILFVAIPVPAALMTYYDHLPGRGPSGSATTEQVLPTQVTADRSPTQAHPSSDPPASGATATASQPTGSGANLLGCPVEELPATNQPFDLCVVKWCQDVGVRDQVSVKVKPKLTNGTNTSVDVSLTHWRLIVADDTDLTKWSPPPGMTDKPIALSLDGTTVWGIPPNPNGVAERVGQTEQFTVYTFATHWTSQSLGAGETLYDKRVKQGDLVFYYPHGSGDPATTKGFLGLAFVKDGRIAAYTPFIEWGTRADPNSF